MRFVSPAFSPAPLLVACLSAGAAAAALALTAPRACAQIVVAPGANAAVEGNINNFFPFNIGDSANFDRYQQVYGASEFTSLPTGGLLITQIAFRPDAIGGAAFSSTLPNVQINLSTTSTAVDAMSDTFASNVGANDTVVFSGALSLSSAFTGPAGGPKDFDILINLSTPFLYDPSAGNLLLDVRNFGGGTTTPFDAENTVGDGVSRVATYADGVNPATGDFRDSVGLVTRFTFAPDIGVVPEPGTLALAGTGLLPLAGAVVRRKRRNA